jgi:hypothetical protein
MPPCDQRCQAGAGCNTIALRLREFDRESLKHIERRAHTLGNREANQGLSLPFTIITERLDVDGLVVLPAANGFVACGCADVAREELGRVDLRQKAYEEPCVKLKSQSARTKPPYILFHQWVASFLPTPAPLTRLLTFDQTELNSVLGASGQERAVRSGRVICTCLGYWNVHGSSRRRAL